MKKLFNLLFVAVLLTVVFTSCDDETDPTPTTTGSTGAEDTAKAIKAAQALIDTKVKSESSATGADDATRWNDWTAAFAYGLLGNTAVTPDNSTAAPTVDKSGNITASETWTKDKVYILKSRVIVTNGATLTIEAGTIIKGDASLSQSQAAALMIAKDGKIMAVGTKTDPIIMTSTDDDIEPGSIVGSLDKSADGRWGGLVILGKAPVSAKTADPQIEGVDAQITEGQYGGSDAAHNSGVVKYVSIRHGGVEIAAGSEINGLTLGGVGSGTVIEHVEVFSNKDDGIELFGGSVNVKNVLVYSVGDDGVDIDQSYTGTVDNYWVFVDDKSDEGLEVDGREGADKGSFTLKNGTISVIGDATATCDFKSKAQGTVDNLVLGGTSSKIKLSASVNADFTVKEDAASNAADGTLVFTKAKFDAVEAYIK